MLPLTAGERTTLRKAGLRLGDISGLAAEELAMRTHWPIARSRALTASAIFQTLSSVGPSMADDLVSLGFHSIEALAKGNPTKMYADFNRKVGHRVDPCVEDVFRCAVAQARDPFLSVEARNWWYWLPYRGTSVVDEDSARR